MARPAEQRGLSRSAAKAWRDRLELASGRTQLAALRRGLSGVSGLAAGTVAGAPPIATLARDGRGAPLVCLHGFGGDKETWLLSAPWLPRRRGLVLIDLPGHGRSGPIDAGAAGARAQAEAVLRVLDARGIDRAVLCGNSMGGGIALHLARWTPDRVRALVLVASVGPDMVENQFVRDLRSGKNELIPDGDEGAAALTRLVLEKPPRVPRAISRHVVAERARARPQLEQVWAGWAAAQTEIPDDLEAIAQPALIVHGACDRVIDVGTGRLLAARLPAGRLVVLDGIGHAPQLEAPRQLARIVGDFLAAL
jgi:abhydrolase domain-containing protein 6